MAIQQNMYGNPYSSMNYGVGMQNPQGMSMGGNPYQQSSMGMTQQTTPPRMSYIPGRMVTAERDIVANEIPMDGNLAVFIQQDLKRVYAKTWGGDGLIHTNVYDLVDPLQQNTEGKEDPIQVILSRLDSIEAAIKEQPRYTGPRKNYNGPKKYQDRRNDSVKEENHHE